jgi:hypothetical protein
MERGERGEKEGRKRGDRERDRERERDRQRNRDVVCCAWANSPFLDTWG